MSEATLIASTAKLTRLQLADVPTPLGTATHRPVPHVEVVEALVETLSFRHIGVVTEEYAVSKDGMKMFGVLDLDTGMPGCRFSIGVRNSTMSGPAMARSVRSGRRLTQGTMAPYPKRRTSSMPIVTRPLSPTTSRTKSEA